jgi:protein-arginine kinase
MRPVSVGTTLTTTTKTTVYTVPTGYYAMWNLAYAVNHSGNNKFIDIVWYDASANEEHFVLDNYVLSPTQFIKFDGGAYIVLEEGDQVRVQAESGSTINVINTFELHRNKG